MKICAIICEYNPFHNGHLYQLREAKRLSGADAVLCVMSGNFVQRGEAAIMDKYTRAKHAVLAGADAVIELPTPFATANAELFAKGAVSLLSSIPAVDTLCFGAENADKLAFISAARYLNNEPKEVSDKIKTAVSSGVSYAKARAQAWAGFIPMEILANPNNILGLEYTRALLSVNANVSILPIARVGAGYNDNELQENFSSASAIRKGIAKGENIGDNLPNFVANDLPKGLENKLDLLEKHAILSKSTEEIKRVCDCTEGLENALKKAAELPETLVETLTSARYTSSRIRRITLQNLLNIEETLLRECLANPLYLRILAAKKERSDVLSALGESTLPIIARAHDENVLNDIAKLCFEKDQYAEKIHALLYNAPKDKTIFV
ncbi:MAG: nucleotidyltransferase family protein [Clostridiales bacterium]|nr:nucleotidyltransferase family protein [Clostridiales bacterium]